MFEDEPVSSANGAANFRVLWLGPQLGRALSGSLPGAMSSPLRRLPALGSATAKAVSAVIAAVVIAAMMHAAGVVTAVAAAVHSASDMRPAPLAIIGFGDGRKQDRAGGEGERDRAGEENPVVHEGGPNC